ncbi:MAG TPA: AI-2E family transporter [Methylomirabilota bacterium]|nr:AI-2E family transporter [Methylomirabilota bacterium]
MAISPTFAGLVLVIACLYWAQAFFIPVALAVLLTYLFSPLVGHLERRRVPSTVAVLGVVMLAFAALGGLGWIVATQMSALGAELPRYRDNIRQKIADVRLLRRDSGLERVQETVEGAAGEAAREVELTKPPAARQPRPSPVVIQQERGLWNLPAAIGAWLDPLGRAGFVVILVPFMLLGRQELRNRIVRLFGFRRLALTTRALDEANARVGRYLLSQTAINATFGVLAAIGLFLLGVPYAVLFGLLGGALRFIPYVGPWIGALLPIAVSLAIFPGWTRPLLLIVFWLVLELFTNMVLETVFWARSAGVSHAGLLLAVGFWTWLWGPIGLVVATPLTVCLLVFARHIPALEFLWILMGDEPVVSPDVLLYQRLLAGDEDEATELLERALAGGRPRERVYDEIVLPALGLAGHDHARGRIDGDEWRLVGRGARDIVESLGPPPGGDGPPDHRVFAAAARGEAEAVTLLMLRHLLLPSRVALDVASPGLLAAEIVDRARRHGADLVAIGSLPPGGLAQARYLCKRLRAGLPAARIVAGRWCAVEEAEALRQQLTDAGADAVGTSLRETRDLLLQFVRVRPEPAPEPVA